ncbi:sulfatase-like hydrolase/transferase [Natronomonas sp.]|uniref:sulfatase-like hydrolase/transferase n=1 Tax=Natronomonas sp. TaxID=2184060 RepID=UPI0039767B3B
MPREERQGFDYWRALECTHDYNHSSYYGDSPERFFWEGYDALAQTRHAERYIRSHDPGNPFLLVLSWGPPHAPYGTAPEEYRKKYDPRKIVLRQNVPDGEVECARQELAGYYAHITALDRCIGNLLETLKQENLADDTIFVFTSDHGDMLRSHGLLKKQHPYDESIIVPFLVRYPGNLKPFRTDHPINTPDIMPTLLALAGIDIPESCEGEDLSGFLTRHRVPEQKAALIMCPSPFGQVSRSNGGREYRGVRTARYTYVRDLHGPWLLFDSKNDPWQMENLVNRDTSRSLQDELDAELHTLLHRTNDEFLPGESLIETWGYKVNEHGTVDYTE